MMRIYSHLAARCAGNTVALSRGSLSRIVCAFALTVAFSSLSQADEPSIYLVEEDWEMVINEPPSEASIALESRLTITWDSSVGFAHTAQSSSIVSIWHRTSALAALWRMISTA